MVCYRCGQQIGGSDRVLIAGGKTICKDCGRKKEPLVYTNAVRAMRAARKRALVTGFPVTMTASARVFSAAVLLNALGVRTTASHVRRKHPRLACMTAATEAARTASHAATTVIALAPRACLAVRHFRRATTARLTQGRISPIVSAGCLSISR